MTRPIPIPSLPPDWPYAPRPALPPAAVRQGATIPGLGEDWTMEAAPGLELDGAGQGLEAAFGRGGVSRLGGVVVRPYRRGGMVAKVNAKTYATPARFRREFAAHRALWEAGFPTVEPLGFAWRRSGLGVEGLYFTRFVDAKPWPFDWTAPVMADLLTALRSLSNWGLWAPDLNATNVMWGADGLVLLDWDRAAWVDGIPIGDYHLRLARSLAKLGAPEPLRAALDQGLAGIGSSRS